MKQKLIFALAAIVLLLGFLGASQLYTGKQQEAATQAASAQQDRLHRMHSPIKGPAEAKVLIVEFFDPACETCRDFYPFVAELMAAHPGQVRVALRHTPFHEGSIDVVRILLAARQQGKYWETLEALFATQEQWVEHHQVVPDRVWPALAGVGLDLDRVRRDMQAPEIAAQITQDMEDAQALNVSKTPEFFVNGRPMPSFGHAQLQTLVEAAVAESYR